MKGNSVNLFDYGRNKIIELAKYLNNDDKESFSLMNEFLNNLKKCDNIGDVEESYAMVKDRMQKNAFLFLKREELLSCCEDESDVELNGIIDEVISNRQGSAANERMERSPGRLVATVLLIGV